MSALELRPRLRPPSADRAALVRRARLLALTGSGWHVLEFAIAVVAGLVAGSVALLGFGLDSLIESLAGFAILWRFAAPRAHGETGERQAQRLVAAGFLLLSLAIVAGSARVLLTGRHPETSWAGIGLAAFTAPTMPLLAGAKRRVGRRLGSAAAVSEAAQSQLCAYLSIALLAGLLANALAGWWWADPASALALAALAAREGLAGWRGAGCDCCA